MARPSPTLLLAAVLAAALGGGWLQTRAADPDDETPPPAFDKEAGYRRRYAALPAEPRGRSTRLGPDARPAATFARTGEASRIGLEEEIPVLKPTLVTLALRNVSARDAAAELAKAAGFKIRTMPPGYLGNEDLPKVTLELDKKPALEALFELASQTGTSPALDELGRMTLTECESDKSAGIWCTAGPFAFVITRIERVVPLGSLSAAGVPGARMHMDFLAEPRVRVLTYPRQLDVEIMQDEHGNDISLVNSRIDPRFGMAMTQFSRQLSLPLNIPAGAGSRIKIFRATGKFTMQTAGQALEFAFGAAAQEKLAGKLTVRVSSLESRRDYRTASVTISRNQCPAAAWEGLVAALPNMQAHAFDDAGRPVGDLSYERKRTGDTFTLVGNWYAGEFGRVPAKLVLDVPTEIQEVTVPLVFRNLLLP